VRLIALKIHQSMCCAVFGHLLIRNLDGLLPVA